MSTPIQAPVAPNSAPESLLRLPVAEDAALTARWDAWIGHNRTEDRRARRHMRYLGIALGIGVLGNLAMALLAGAR